MAPISCVPLSSEHLRYVRGGLDDLIEDGRCSRKSRVHRVSASDSFSDHIPANVTRVDGISCQLRHEGRVSTPSRETT